MYQGVDAAAHPLETKRSLAYIPKQIALSPSLSGEESFRFFTALSGMAERDLDVETLFQEVGLRREAAARRVQIYSNGMRQKVGIAIAMATGAKVLLLDEPTAGLDPAATNEFSRFLRRLRARGAAVLMATHDLYRAKAVAHAPRHHVRGSADCDVERGLDGEGCARSSIMTSRSPLARSHPYRRCRRSPLHDADGVASILNDWKEWI